MSDETRRLAQRLCQTWSAWGLADLSAAADPVVDALWRAIDVAVGDTALTALWRGLSRPGDDLPAPLVGPEAVKTLEALSWSRARELSDLDAIEKLHRAIRAAKALVPLVAPTWPGRRDWGRASGDELVVALVATARSWPQEGLDAGHFAGLAGWVTTASVVLAPGLADAERAHGQAVAYDPLPIAEWCSALDVATQRLLVELPPCWQRALMESTVALRALAVDVAARAP